MRQMYSTIVAERNSLRDEIIGAYEEWEQERENNLCTEFEENGSCTIRHCCKMHRWDKRQVHFEDEAEE